MFFVGRRAFTQCWHRQNLGPGRTLPALSISNKPRTSRAAEAPKLSLPGAAPGRLAKFALGVVANKQRLASKLMRAQLVPTRRDCLREGACARPLRFAPVGAGIACCNSLRVRHFSHLTAGHRFKVCGSRIPHETSPRRATRTPGANSAWCSRNILGLGPGDRRCKSCRADQFHLLSSDNESSARLLSGTVLVRIQPEQPLYPEGD